MKYILTISIVIFAFILRLYNVGEFPSGFYSDEAMFSYEAYSIGKTAKDQYGNVLPLTLKAFGDYRPGLFTYATIPFVSVLGLTEQSARLPSTVLSVFTIICAMLIAKEITKRNKVAYLTGIILAILPWDIQLSRMSHETNLATFLVTFGVYFLIRSFKKDIWIIAAIISFGVSLYAYYSARLFSVLFLAIICILYRKSIFHSRRTILFLIITGIMILIPLTGIMLDKDAGWSRVNNVSLWGDKGIVAKTIQNRQEDVITGQSISKIFHNKVIDSTVFFLSSYTIHFEPRFLLFTGDPNKIYSTPDNGILLITFPIFILAGLYFMVKEKPNHGLIIFLWVLIGLIPDSLTRFAPAAPRIHLIVPAVSIIAAYGLYELLEFTKQKRSVVITLAIIGVCTLTIFHFAFFLHSYFFHLPIRNAREWQYGIKEVAEYVKENKNNYDKIWISEKAGSWIYYLFFLSYDPKKAQSEVRLIGNDEYGMGKVFGFDKFIFKPIPGKFDLLKNITYVGEPTDFDSKIIPSEIIYYPNKEPIYYVVTTEDLKDLEKRKK